MFPLPSRLITEVRGYRRQYQEFLTKGADPAATLAWRAYRVPMGVYEERSGGTMMVRVRIPAGVLLPAHLEHLANLAEKHGEGRLHLTTRQEPQLHGVRAESVADVQEGLLEIGLSARGGGGNTVRNVTADPLSGHSADEAFDVRPHALALSAWLIQVEGSFDLPRKYKIAFSASEEDRACTTGTDAGFLATVQHGQKGFVLFAAGGLGNQPSAGIVLADFLPESEIFLAAEAIRRIFSREGDRVNRHKARLRHALARIGEAAFRAQFQFECAKLRSEGLPIAALPFPNLPLRPLPKINASVTDAGPLLIDHHNPGRYGLRITPHLGDLHAHQARLLAGFAHKYGDGVLTLTQRQDIILWGLDLAECQEIRGILTQAGIPCSRPSRSISCAGASTCKLGIGRSRDLETAIEQAVQSAHLEDRLTELDLRISGCPNSCGTHLVAGLGLEGRVRRVGDRLMPYYTVFLGGGSANRSLTLAQNLGAIPARRVPEFIVALLKQTPPGQKPSTSCTQSLIQTIAKLPEKPEEILYHDWGMNTAFSLAGRGPGECSSGVLDLVLYEIDRAEHLLPTDPSAAFLAAAGAFLPMFGVETQSPQEMLKAFHQHLCAPGWVHPDAADIAWPITTKPLPIQVITDLVKRIRALQQSLDGRRNFTLERFGHRKHS